jgi:hypothetical protein
MLHSWGLTVKPQEDLPDDSRSRNSLTSEVVEPDDVSTADQ